MARDRLNGVGIGRTRLVGEQRFIRQAGDRFHRLNPKGTATPGNESPNT
jgi:hypothetical protein